MALKPGHTTEESFLGRKLRERWELKNPPRYKVSDVLRLNDDTTLCVEITNVFSDNKKWIYCFSHKGQQYYLSEDEVNDFGVILDEYPMVNIK